jgi:hypothetical protein
MHSMMHFFFTFPKKENGVPSPNHAVPGSIKPKNWMGGMIET